MQPFKEEKTMTLFHYITVFLKDERIKGGLIVGAMSLLLSSCTISSNPYRGSGTDELTKSECSPCKKQVIYRNGQWL